MKHLKKFETRTAYEAAKNHIIIPSVSYIIEDNDVEYRPYIEINGVKWATMNVGATASTDAGLYFQWGDTQGYTAEQVGTDKTFNWANYKYSDNGTTAMTKYNNTDGKTVLDAEDDAVTAAWGGNWRMATKDDFDRLSNVCSTALTSNYIGSGAAGLVFTVTANTADKGKELFFPAAGMAVNDNTPIIGNFGYYWTSSLSSTVNAYDVDFVGGSTTVGDPSPRYYGFPVRGVLNE